MPEIVSALTQRQPRRRERCKVTVQSVAETSPEFTSEIPDHFAHICCPFYVSHRPHHVQHVKFTLGQIRSDTVEVDAQFIGLVPKLIGANGTLTLILEEPTAVGDGDAFFPFAVLAAPFLASFVGEEQGACIALLLAAPEQRPEYRQR